MTNRVGFEGGDAMPSGDFLLIGLRKPGAHGPGINTDNLLGKCHLNMTHHPPVTHSYSDLSFSPTPPNTNELQPPTGLPSGDCALRTHPSSIDALQCLIPIVQPTPNVQRHPNIHAPNQHPHPRCMFDILDGAHCGGN